LNLGTRVDDEEEEPESERTNRLWAFFRSEYVWKSKQERRRAAAAEAAATEAAAKAAANVAAAAAKRSMERHARDERDALNVSDAMDHLEFIDFVCGLEPF
jgi:membrane protein involved in colicin uptake